MPDPDNTIIHESDVTKYDRIEDTTVYYQCKICKTKHTNPEKAVACYDKHCMMTDGCNVYSYRYNPNARFPIDVVLTFLVSGVKYYCRYSLSEITKNQTILGEMAGHQDDDSSSTGDTSDDSGNSSGG